MLPSVRCFSNRKWAKTEMVAGVLGYLFSSHLAVEQDQWPLGFKVLIAQARLDSTGPFAGSQGTMSRDGCPKTGSSLRALGIALLGALSVPTSLKKDFKHKSSMFFFFF